MPIILGVDEAGRGAWAGPLFVAAVILDNPIDGVKDSKKLSKIQRQKLFTLISIQAKAIGIGWASAYDIDKFGLTVAETKAIESAIEQIKIPFDQIVIDGSHNFIKKNRKAIAVIRADESVACVSAASIIAKVTRDEFMRQQAKIFSNYLFDLHVGYGTKLHLDALKKYGVCELHRRSYKPVKAFL